MSIVLLGWELGSHLGHVTKLKRIAERLQGHGHTPVFALKNVVESAAVVSPRDLRVLQAPVYFPGPRSSQQPLRASSYADVLGMRGFADPAELGPLVHAWERILDMVEPQLVICDSAPTLCLAAYGTVPTVVVGDGFMLPPAHLPRFPRLLARVAPLCDQEQILAAVQHVQRQRGRQVPEHVTSFLGEAARYVLAVPELDPYAGVRSEPLVGPLEQPPRLSPLPDEPRFFAYLGYEYDHIVQLLLELSKTAFPGSVYLRGAPAAVADSLRAAGLDVAGQPADFREVIPAVSLVVHHGGAGTALDALATGRPQIILPTQVEQGIKARALKKLGVATFLAGKLTSRALAEAVEHILNEPTIAERATQLATAIRRREKFNALELIVDGCLARLEQTG